MGEWITPLIDQFALISDQLESQLSLISDEIDMFYHADLVRPCRSDNWLLSLTCQHIV